MEENTLNQWAWTGAGNETRRTHEGNTPKLPYNVMQPTNKRNFIITLLLLQNLITKLILKEPRTDSFFFVAPSFLGKEGSGSLNDHRANSLYSHGVLEKDQNIRGGT